MASPSADQQFQTQGPGSARATSGPASIRCIAVWLIAIWPLTLVLHVTHRPVSLYSLLFPTGWGGGGESIHYSPLSLLLPLLARIPDYSLFQGPLKLAYEVVLAVASLGSGLGLLRLSSYARTWSIALCSLAILSPATKLLLFWMRSLPSPTQGYLHPTLMALITQHLSLAVPPALAIWFLLTRKDVFC